MCHGISLWFWQGCEVLTQRQSSSLIKKNFGIQSLQNWLYLLALLSHTLLSYQKEYLLRLLVMCQVLSPITVPILQMQKQRHRKK